jgi:hypothetical protein
MADERDPKVSRSYRELGAEEPSRELDERILAASRRNTVRRGRWYGPVAVAAVLMLAVAVTLQVERQKPDEKVVETPPAEAAKPSAQEKKQFTPEPPPPPRQNMDALAKRQTEERARGDAARDGAASAPAAEPAQRETEAQRPQASAAGARLMSKAESPEAWLERIAELRRQGKDEEADKALAEFRKRYPDYRLTDEMRTKVERK